ncbi:DUF421 domain-containing protein [Paenibacillus nasutitermitis]|uniref:YetF C-terminal domain-containing protein n=1 Tax=Paenibacillus nasutitermitis TaxID=1652958 RepID=A0A916Z7M6_9BACL|nr:DUF421 domain-containing protein [Paenibacillus nasutitermitis]GGD80628.1 hypothetical protein GCM10010911_43460 [Paenibacillus nasutitermitis]
MPDWLSVAVRTLLAVAVLFIMTKLLGKRQVSQLSLFEYITGITIGSLAAYISLDIDMKWYLGIVSLCVWVGVSLGIEYLQIKSKRVRDFIDTKGTVLIKDGKILEENLKKERLTTDELMEQLRSKQVFLASDVEFAIMEPSGSVNVLLTRENQPLTAKHTGIKVNPEQEPQAVIMDGRIMDEPLATMGLSREWLNTELETIGVTPENVFLGQVDANQQLFVDLFDDQLVVPKPNIKAALYALLKKCEADLEMFSLSTEEEEAKHMYERCSQSLERTLLEIKPYLKN